MNPVNLKDLPFMINEETNSIEEGKIGLNLLILFCHKCLNFTTSNKFCFECMENYCPSCLINNECTNIENHKNKIPVEFQRVDKISFNLSLFYDEIKKQFEKQNKYISNLVNENPPSYIINSFQESNKETMFKESKISKKYLQKMKYQKVMKSALYFLHKKQSPITIGFIK